MCENIYSHSLTESRTVLTVGSNTQACIHTFPSYHRLCDVRLRFWIWRSRPAWIGAQRDFHLVFGLVDSLTSNSQLVRSPAEVRLKQLLTTSSSGNNQPVFLRFSVCEQSKSIGYKIIKVPRCQLIFFIINQYELQFSLFQSNRERTYLIFGIYISNCVFFSTFA